MSDNSRNGGIGFFGALTLLFIGLKLGKIISWSWILVLLPLLIPFLIFAIVLVVIGIAIAIKYLINKG